jgi:hypothetical protein
MSRRFVPCSPWDRRLEDGMGVGMRSYRGECMCPETSSAAC